MVTKRETFHTATPCDECGGPTIALPSGSIWCSAEDPHPGGHFVVRVAFERRPGAAPITPRPVMSSRQATDRTGPRVRKVAEIRAKVEAERQPTFAGGYDDFVESK